MNKTLKPRKVKEMASEYRFDYKKAKPNHFAKKIKLNVAWTTERFVEEEKAKKSVPAKPMPAAKTKPPKAKAPGKKSPTKKKAAPKGKKRK